MPKFHKYIYHSIIRPSRLKEEAKIVNQLVGKTILEVGYFDDSFKKLSKKDLEYTGVDPNPTIYIEGMPLTNIENFNPGKKFDIVVASNILEHTTDPVKAIKKLRQLSNKYIFISVPYEPFYTITRFFVPEEEHYWTIHPNIFEYYLGKPVKEKYIHMLRTYTAVYKFPFSKNE